MARQREGHPGSTVPLLIGGHGDTIPNGGEGMQDCLKCGTGSCCRLDASFYAAVKSCWSSRVKDGGVLCQQPEILIN